MVLLDKTYSEFILCPKIDKIERIKGDIRSHKVYASALNYDWHHNVSFCTCFNLYFAL